jgi:hypothetical protein
MDPNQIRDLGFDLVCMTLKGEIEWLKLREKDPACLMLLQA